MPRRVEGAHDVAGPLLSLQHPAQQDGKAFVRIHEAAVFGDGADAVRVAIGRQPGVALSFSTVCRSISTCGSMGSGLIPGNSGFSS